MVDDLYTIDEVAERLKVSRSTVYRAIRENTIQSIHIGTRQRIRHIELERLLREGTGIEQIGPFRHTVPAGKASRR